MNLDNFIKECKELPVSLALQKTVSLGNGSYKILCETSKTNFKPSEIKKAVSRMFNNKVSVVEASIQSKTENLVSMIVKANVRSLAFKDGKLPENKKMITASIAADVNDDSIWEIQGSGDDKRLVLKQDDNFEKIFQHNNRICTAALANLNTQVDSGDYISYYDSKANVIKAGYAIVSTSGDIEVIDRDLNEISIEPENVLDSTDLNDLDKNPVEAALKSGDASKILDYMKTLFKDTEFYDKLDELIGARVKLGPDGKFSSTMVTSSYEDNMDQVKEEIKEFLINDSIDELRSQVLNTDIDEIDDAEGNSDGDIDLANDEEIESYAEEEPTDADEVEEITLEAEEEAPEEISVDTNEEPINDIEEVSDEEDMVNSELGDLLDEDEIQVTTEAELDDGDFEDVDISQVNDKDLEDKFSNILTEE